MRSFFGHRRLVLSLLIAVLPVAFSAPLVAADAKPEKLSLSNKWRIEVHGNAESDGTVQLVVTPDQGVASTVNVTLVKGRSENHVAKDIVTALDAQLPKDAFHVERDDGEDVLIKKRGKTPNFNVQVAANSVKDLHLNIEKE